MKRKTVNIIYWFDKPSLTHFNIYVGYCVEFAKRGYDTCILSYYGIRNYLERKSQISKYIKEYKQDRLKMAFQVCFRKTKFIQLSLRLFFTQFRYKKIIIIVRKINYRYLEKLKANFPKVLIIYESEGDFVSEYNYLKRFDKKIGSEVIQEYKNNIKTSQKIYEICDIVVTGTEHMGRLLEYRYPYLKGKTRTVIPTFSRKKFYFNKAVRLEMRKKLGVDGMKVYIYVGNINYGWQNFDTNIDLFKLILEREENSCFIALVPPNNRDLAQEYLIKAHIDSTKYLITSVENFELADYLMASDMAFIIRDIHTMNYTAPTAKTGEYLATGLPLIATSAISLYNPFIQKYRHGVICYKKQDFLERIQEIIEFKADDDRRRLISIEAAKEFSFEANAGEYIKIIEKAVEN